MAKKKAPEETTTAVAKTSNFLSRLKEIGDQQQDGLKALASSAAYLKNLKLLNGMSKQIQTPSDDDPVGCVAGGYLLNNEVFLGKTVRVVPIKWRAKAIRFEESGGGVAITSYDIQSDIFKEIHRSKAKQDRAGPEFLFWLPEQREFAVMHFAKTASQNAPDFNKPDTKQLPCILYSQTVKGKKGTWFTPRGRPGDFDLDEKSAPSDEEMTKALDMFDNVKSDEIAPKEESERVR